MKRRNNNWGSSKKSKKQKKHKDFDGFDLRDIVRENRNCNPLKKEDRPIAARLEWLQMEHDEKRSVLQRQVVKVVRHNEIKLLAEEAYRMKNYFDTDPEIQQWPFVTNESQDVLRARYCLMGKRVYDRNNTNPDIQLDTIPNEFDSYKRQCRYEAPRTRIRITENLSLDPNHRIPVYSDIKEETLENFTVPGSLFFDYIERNVVDDAIEEDLAESVRIAEKEKNVIKCECTSPSDFVVPCYLNPNCQCSKMNVHLQGLQKVGPGKAAHFQAFDPIMFHNGIDTFYDNVGFSCSELCACKGQCNNNVFFLMEKQLFNFEIFRRNLKVGFEVRSPMLIPAGTPVLEFTGKIVNKSRLHVNVMDYAMTMTVPQFDDQLLKHILSFNRNFTQEYKQHLRRLSREMFHMDCKYHGNITRFICHSCTPNLELVRIYQKSFTPAHIRLALVAIDDICPRVPLTIDYGNNYYLAKCQCNTFACPHGPDFAKFKNLTLEATEKCFHDMFQQNFTEHRNEMTAITTFYKNVPVPPFRVDKIENQDVIQLE